MANEFETGFLRDTASGVVVLTTDAVGATWQEGFLRAPTGELVATTTTAGATWQEGFLRDADGVLVVEQDGAGTFETGFVRSSSGVLEVSQDATGAEWESGFLRTPSGLLVVSGLADSTLYSSIVLADSPTSYWRLNETSGTVATDQQGVNDGTYVGSPTLGVTALAPHGDRAAQFVAANSEEVTLPGPALSTVCSIEFWFTWTSGIALMRDHTQAAGWLIGFDSSGVFHVRLAGTTEIITSAATADVRDGNVHHLVVSKNGTSATVYLDNVSIGSSAGAASTVSTGIWHVGRNGSSAGQYSDCVIDEIAIYPTALSAAQVSAHFNA